jgi:translation initiation factor 4E
MGSTFYLFRKGIKPMWEDPRNVHGGKWVYQLTKSTAGRTRLSEMWLRTVLLLIGEQFGHNSDAVVGAVLQLRPKGDRLSVWTDQWKNGESTLHIGCVWVPVSSAWGVGVA